MISPRATVQSPAGLRGDPVANRYLLKERLGRGSLAEVFRAADLEGGPDVAVKMAVGNSEKHVERIRDEAAVLAALDHPSIIRFITHSVMPAGTSFEGRPFLVEELALGASLAEATRTRLPRAGDVAIWAGGLLGALAHLHGQGLVHRDIKPVNLMLSGLRRSPVRIIDLGIAAAAGAPPEPGISSGTVHYMSPEQAAGGPAHSSWDIYAMGLVLLELLTGSKAFPGTAIESLVARTLRSPEIPNSLGPGWCSFLTALTAMDSDARPTAAEAAVMAARLVPPVAAGLANSTCRRMAVFPARRSRQLV
ncbi:serine/threonine-protein kinase [Pseudarthrobacter sp. NPDC058329]|uniref:serine/threonine-protein kinase n=1 Tax=Pseudarthrobacter sp. NPDC058329 TaxID=3346448 RepID=UPI0036DCE4E8